MKTYKAIIATTEVDRQNEKMSLESLKTMIKNFNSNYTPITLYHDPRNPTIGRSRTSKLVKINDKDYGVEGEFELFESEADYKIDKTSKKTIVIHKLKQGLAQIRFDINFMNKEDQKTIKEMNNILGSTETPQYEGKKNIEPIPILTISVAFILGAFMSGFFNKFGSDCFDRLKVSLKKIFSKKAKEMPKKDKLFLFEAIVEKNGYSISAQIIISNPSDKDFDQFFNKSLRNLDKIIEPYFLPELEIKKLVFEYKDGNIKLNFAIRKDCVPLQLQTKKR